MGTTMSVLLAGQRNCAQDGDEDQDGRYFEGQQQIFEQNFAQVGGRDDVVAQPGLRHVGARGKKDKREQANQDGDSRDTYDVGGAAAMGSLFFAGVQQHDDESKENHDRAGVHDDLGGSQEFSAEK